MKTIVIYHKDCTDGTAAAAVALRKYPDAKTFPLSHGFESHEMEPIFQELEADSRILVVDGTFGVRELLDKGYEVTAIDHHAGIAEEMSELSRKESGFTFIFDNNRSGASLAWSTLFPEERVPRIIELIEDNDLWKGRYGNDTKFVSNYLYMLSNKPHELLPLFESDLSPIMKAGEIITLYSDFKVAHSVNTVEPLSLNIGGYDVPFYNITENKSDAGNRLSTLRNRTVALFSIDGNKVKISFRSLDSHSPSALDIAKLLGGNGHRNASGAGIPLDQFLSLIRASA